MKKGDRVKISKNALYGGAFATVESESFKTMNNQCYWILIEPHGERRSFSEIYLTKVDEPEVAVEKERDYITLEQVCQAKKDVDKAQRDFVELLSRYQLQEASKK